MGTCFRVKCLGCLWKILAGIKIAAWWETADFIIFQHPMADHQPQYCQEPPLELPTEHLKEHPLAPQRKNLVKRRKRLREEGYSQIWHQALNAPCAWVSTSKREALTSWPIAHTSFTKIAWSHTFKLRSMETNAPSSALTHSARKSWPQRTFTGTLHRQRETSMTRYLLT